jgi:hypothetical protein
VAGGWRGLHNEELNSFYASPMMMKNDEMGGSCSRNVRDEKCVQFWSEKLKGGDHSEDLGVDGRIVLECILKVISWEGVHWIHLPG